MTGARMRPWIVGMIAESRAAIHVVLHTAMAWRLTGDRRHFERCVKELDAACALPDWNPRHFLDTAEMATAVALGLDWLHADLDADQRDRYRAALVAKAIRPAEEVFAKGGWWAKVSNNWSQVCGAGIAVACAAVAEDRAALDASVFAKCLALLHDCERFYEGGGYPEGPAYWDYGTSYHVLGLAVADALGEPIVVAHDMARSTEFMAHLRGPSGLLFNFADASPRPDVFVAARGWLIERMPVATMRGDEDDPDAPYIAVKGGTPRANHGHMDVGSFVYDALGRRWIHDLGGDDYNLPGYFGKARFDYFRLSARSHNVLLVDGKVQNPVCEPCAFQPVGAVRWQAMIDAEPTIDGGRVVLRKDAKAITLDVATT